MIEINRTNHTATLKFKDGRIKTYPVRQDVDLSDHNVGEVVVFHLTKMMAISVNKAENSKK